MAYPYEALEIPETASSTEIRKQYLKKIQQYPPESDPVRFQEITEAYSEIKDEVGRARLKLFGISGKHHHLCLAGLLPAPENKRGRVSAELWLKAIRENR